MENNDYFCQIPYGTKDLLPKEAKRKRMLEQRMAELFELWGYEEIVTPTYEYLDTFASYSADSGLIKFLDKNNSTLVLRPDMTAPIARIAASRLKDAVLPLRLSYIANVFRYEQAQAGRQCEFYQGGVELLGSPGSAADAEVIALAVETLRISGVNNFKLSLGNISFINGIMEEAGLKEDASMQIKTMMMTRNIVGIENCLKKYDIMQSRQKIIMNLHELYGGKEILNKAKKMIKNSKSQDAVDNLLEIYELLESYNVQDYISFDLGLIRNFNYYTGVVFEGYMPGLGFPVLGGGRYDNLVSSFGKNCPATGFAIGLERVLLAKERQQADRREEKNILTFIAGSKECQIQAAAYASKLRKAGQCTILAPAPMNKEEAAGYAKLRGCKNFIYIE